jgi:hypothetical protein
MRFIYLHNDHILESRNPKFPPLDVIDVAVLLNNMYNMYLYTQFHRLWMTH